MSSGQSWGPMPGELAYVATKGAIEAFTLSLASELAPIGFTVNAVDPGATETGWISEQIRRESSVRSGVAKLNQPECRSCKIQPGALGTAFGEFPYVVEGYSSYCSP